MKRLLNVAMLLSIIAFGFLSLSMTGPGPQKKKWIQLFNGKDLKNWKVKIRGYKLNDNYANTFRVENGLMKVSYDGYNDEFKKQYGHIFYKKPFSSYIIAVEYRFVGKQPKDGE